MRRDDTPDAGSATGDPPPPIDFHDPGFKACTHETYARLRRQAPVHRITQRDGRPLWLVTRHADVRRVLQDPCFVKNRGSVPAVGEPAQQPALPAAMRYLNQHLLSVDPPRHTRLRALIQRAFVPRMIDRLRPRIQSIADELLDPVMARGSIELIGEYAMPLPIRIIAELLGIPLEDQGRFREFSNVLITHVGNIDERALRDVVPAVEAFAASMHDLFELKRRQPRDDLVTTLVQLNAAAGADAGERALDDDELISMLLLLVVAGHETTAHLIGNGVLALLCHPDQMARLSAEPSRLPQAIDELLRFDGPVETSTLRYARDDVELGGRMIPRGDLVMAVITSANRDPDRFADPDRLDIGRDAGGHLAFGRGIHFCIGAALARIEAEIAIGTLLRRAPGLRLAVDADTLRWRVGPLTRGLDVLPLHFDRHSEAFDPGTRSRPAGRRDALWFRATGKTI